MPGREDLDRGQRRMLQHEVRRSIYELVARAPGLTKRQIADRLDVGHKLVQHHIERLEAYELLAIRDGDRDNERICFLAEDANLAEDEDKRILYGHPTTRGVALFLVENPGSTTKAIAGALGRRSRTIREHLARLRDRNLVERIWLERRVEHDPTADLEAWAREVGEGYLRPWTTEE